MKKLFTLALAAIMTISAFAQSALNDKADSILGEYESVQGDDGYKVRVTKNANGTYKAQIFWLKDNLDKKGERRRDTKNPDKSLRNVYSDQIVLMDGLKYDAQKKQWGDTKIYDPQRGLKANATLVFESDGRLKVRGKFGPIFDTAYWVRLK